ncbi:MAG: TetR/AcrR family transcriptional regulator [Thermodesulfovibrionales bacterium]
MNKRSGIESKKRILDAAMKVFAEYGYSKANMRMIAKASDISIGGLYLYFKNKEDLYLTMMKSRMGDFAGKTMESVKDINDPAKAISIFMAMSLNYAKKHKELILVQGREHGFAFGLEMKRKFFKKQRGLIENIIRQGIQSGVFKKVDVQKTARIIFSVIRGFILSIIVEPDSLFSPEECSNLILNGLVRRNDK